LRSGTAIGALVREAAYAESKADFTHKMTMALKEANETIYWLELLHQPGYVDSDVSGELVKLLASIVKTSNGAS
jgi:four helix bundle protein